ncbi:MAG: hypothetical protein ACJAZO_000967 [Myxococcota bacterium]
MYQQTRDGRLPHGALGHVRKLFTKPRSNATGPAVLPGDERCQRLAQRIDQHRGRTLRRQRDNAGLLSANVGDHSVNRSQHRLYRLLDPALQSQQSRCSLRRNLYTRSSLVPSRRTNTGGAYVDCN